MKHAILITGGAGFIGVNAARRFLDKGWEVTILDDFSRYATDTNMAIFEKEHPERCRVVRADVSCDFDVLRREVEKHDTILHLAAQVAVTTSLVDPRRDFEVNALGTFNLLEAVRLSRSRPLVLFSSTNKVYGALPHLPVRDTGNRYIFCDPKLNDCGVSEREALDFHSPYGCSKGCADQYVTDYGRIYGFDTVVFRQSCIYGRYQFGVEDQGWVAWFAIAAVSGRDITIYGDGKQVRDILYVDDLTSLYAAAIEHPECVSGKAYNVGGGPSNTLSLLELLAIFDKEYALRPRISYSEVRAGDQYIFVADVSRIADDIGWRPTTSPEPGISKMMNWIGENRRLIVETVARQNQLAPVAPR
jgi:CDP-paratose 2-epimerase